MSDAGAPFAMQVDRDTMWHQQAMRALDIATDQARGLRKRMLFADARAADHKVAFWGIDLDASKAGRPDVPTRGDGETGTHTHAARFVLHQGAGSTHKLGLRGMRSDDADLCRYRRAAAPGLALPGAGAGLNGRRRSTRR